MYNRLTHTRMRGTRIPRLFGVRSYLNNSFSIYKRLTPTRIRVELASRAYLGLVIKIIILPCINV